MASIGVGGVIRFSLAGGKLSGKATSSFGRKLAAWHRLLRSDSLPQASMALAWILPTAAWSGLSSARGKPV